MFSMGSMTLGYFSPVPVAAKLQATDNAQTDITHIANEDDRSPMGDDTVDYRQELERAFLTPWHLFF
ncbi:hypothetical protein [Pararhizobium sp.]|uniref:hypothetical protein n=1 Tax=Pararhizobium sp. TaxID=1977563 RepID=UPI002724C2BC|nr:hypothetical protein [Pararhizobium sp.]MDO9417702.1 hypothetical protein [Pararhizobium sp.]